MEMLPWILSQLKDVLTLVLCFGLMTGTSRIHVRDIGQTVCGQKGPDDNKTLQQCRFIIGDYMDVKILTPKRNMRMY